MSARLHVEWQEMYLLNIPIGNYFVVTNKVLYCFTVK